MTPEGDLVVRLGMREDRIHTVQVATSRLPLPAQLTRGRPPMEVAQTIPRLFSVCASAQGAAAHGALAAAGGLPAAAPAQLNAEVRGEAVVELLTRLLIDWPRVMGVAPDVDAVARARQATGRSLDTCRDIARDRVFGSAPADWLGDGTPDALEGWVEDAPTIPARLFGRLESDYASLGRSDIRTMPPMTAELIATLQPRIADDPTFGLTPEWAGAPVETGALARRIKQPRLSAFVERHGNSAAARLLARLIDLAALLAGDDETELPMVRQHAVAPGAGIGLVETARGLLLHYAEVRDGLVGRYRIVAPTDWNFHPEGALPRGLAGRRVSSPETAVREARVLVQALDPCVACTVEVAHA